ncbi:hypothetical protein ACMAVI_001858 [Burkholderia cenocepacia]
MNQLSMVEFRNLSGLCELSLRKRSGVRDHKNLQRLFDHMGWAPDPAMILGDAHKYDHLFYSDRLRICVECVSGMYHSTWHQFMGLVKCPLHGCPLRDSCQNCSEPLGAYILETAIAEGFVCARCGTDLSGRVRDLSDHLRFRVSSCLSPGNFSESEEQLRHASAVRDALAYVGQMSPFNRINMWWPGQVAGWQVISDIAGADRGHNPAFSALTWLAWPVHRERQLRNGEWHLFYRQALEALKAWLIRRFPQCRSLGDQPDLFDHRDVPRQGLCPPEVMAYMLMRYFGERPIAWGLQAPIGSIPVRALKILMASRREGSRNMQADTVWAMVFGRFAAYYWWVKAGCPSPIESFRCGEPALAMWEVQRRWEPSVAAVAFPTIEGLPFQSTDRPRLRLSDAVELVREDMRYKRCATLAYRPGWRSNDVQEGERTPGMSNHSLHEDRHAA